MHVRHINFDLLRYRKSVKNIYMNLRVRFCILLFVLALFGTDIKAQNAVDEKMDAFVSDLMERMTLWVKLELMQVECFLLTITL